MPGDTNQRVNTDYQVNNVNRVKQDTATMSKKDFAGGLNSLLGEMPDRLSKRGRPKTQTKVVTKSSQQGTKENETRATFILNEDLLDKLKAIAYWERVFIKEVVNAALEEAIAKYEKKNGPVKPLPKKQE
jgi:hypothetical protein